MKNFALIFCVLLLLAGCKEKPETSVEDVTVFEEPSAEIAMNYPEGLSAVFEAHGGIDRWNQMNNLCFEFEKPNGVEKHTVSLKDRRVKIESPTWNIGFDGADVWLDQKEEEAYKGNARFYHNLYFYFYAMPFVLGDDGITYTELGPTELEGKMYGGVKVSYGDGVGDSPKDEYILYFDPETKVMSWLAYTVTYRTNEKSDRWSYIKYSKWNPVNGLTLPKSLAWYQVEDGKPTEMRNEVEFSKVTITETQLEDAMFEKPAEAVVVER